jgi:hypothetical protein
MIKIYWNKHSQIRTTLKKRCTQVVWNCNKTKLKIHFEYYNWTNVCLVYVTIYINVREYRRVNQKWTIQRNWQHRLHKTKKNIRKTIIENWEKGSMSVKRSHRILFIYTIYFVCISCIALSWPAIVRHWQHWLHKTQGEDQNKTNKQTNKQTQRNNKHKTKTKNTKKMSKYYCYHYYYKNK